MRMNLKDMLIALLGLALVSGALVVLIDRGNVSFFGAATVSSALALAYIALASTAFKHFHWRPLLVPPCPHCGKRCGFTVLNCVRLCEFVRCTACSGEFIAAYGNREPVEMNLEHLPTQTLHWPEFIGNWRTIVRTEPNNRIHPTPERRR